MVSGVWGCYCSTQILEEATNEHPPDGCSSCCSTVRPKSIKLQNYNGYGLVGDICYTHIAGERESVLQIKPKALQTARPVFMKRSQSFVRWSAGFGRSSDW